MNKVTRRIWRRHLANLARLLVALTAAALVVLAVRAGAYAVHDRWHFTFFVIFYYGSFVFAVLVWPVYGMCCLIKGYTQRVREHVTAEIEREEQSAATGQDTLLRPVDGGR